MIMSPLLSTRLAMPCGFPVFLCCMPSYDTLPLSCHVLYMATVESLMGWPGATIYQNGSSRRMVGNFILWLILICSVSSILTVYGTERIVKPTFNRRYTFSLSFK